MRKFLVALFIVLALPFFGSAAALEPGEALDDPVLEARARTLMAELRCLVCQSENIEASPSPFAAEVRALVREQIAAGRSDGEIKTFLTARYGDAILYRPRWGSATWILWLGPFVVLGLGMIFVVIAVRGARGARGGGGGLGDLSDEEQAALARVLAAEEKTTPGG